MLLSSHSSFPSYSHVPSRNPSPSSSVCLWSVNCPCDYSRSNQGIWGDRGAEHGTGPQKLTVVGSDLTQHPLQDTFPHFSLRSSKATHPAFLRGMRGMWPTLDSPLPVCSCFGDQVVSAPGGIQTCMFMFAEKHFCLGERHSNPYPVTMRNWL